MCPGGDMPFVRGTLGVKACVLGGDMPFVRGTLGFRCVSWGEICPLSGVL